MKKAVKWIGIALILFTAVNFIASAESKIKIYDIDNNKDNKYLAYYLTWDIEKYGYPTEEQVTEVIENKFSTNKNKIKYGSTVEVYISSRYYIPWDIAYGYKKLDAQEIKYNNFETFMNNKN